MRGDTAGMANPNQPKKWDIRYPVMPWSLYSWGTWLGKGNRCSGAGWALDDEKIALCIPCFVYSFLSVLLLLFSCCFAVLLNCLYVKPRVLPFSSSCPSHPTAGGRSKRAATWLFVASWG